MIQPFLYSSPGRSRSARRPQSGFTLLELMVVILIIGILMGYLLMNADSIFGSAKKSETKVRMNTLAILIQEYRTIQGAYPDDRLPRSAAGSGNLNANAEALFVSFFAGNYSGETPNQKWLVNTDGDSSAKSLTRLASRELFEIADSWDNPILYFESLHYSKAAQAMAGFEEIYEEQVATAARNDKTGGWRSPNGFQLISAGEDCIFGTDDDIIVP
jgi:prepilin-type N-terminal cleavage/methylation domain-containing protein